MLPREKHKLHPLDLKTVGNIVILFRTSQLLLAIDNIFLHTRRYMHVLAIT